MGGCQVEGGVVTHVGRVDADAACQQQVHDGLVALLGSPVQQREAVVIAEHNYLHTDTQTNNLQLGIC